MMIGNKLGFYFIVATYVVSMLVALFVLFTIGYVFEDVQVANSDDLFIISIGSMIAVVFYFCTNDFYSKIVSARITNKIYANNSKNSENLEFVTIRLVGIDGVRYAGIIESFDFDKHGNISHFVLSSVYDSNSEGMKSRMYKIYTDEIVSYSLSHYFLET